MTLPGGISTTRAVERCERLAALGPAPAWWRVFALRRWLAAYRAIMALDISVHAEMLRSVYTDEKLRELATAPNPFLKIFKAPAPAGQYLGRKWVEPVCGRCRRPLVPESVVSGNDRCRPCGDLEKAANARDAALLEDFQRRAKGET